MEKINILENYISKETCEFIINSLDPYTETTPRENIKTFSIWDADNVHKIRPSIKPARPKLDSPNANIAVDFLTLLCVNFANTISEYYNDEYIIKRLFFNIMLPGSQNILHMDNFYLNDDTKILQPRPQADYDKSGLLYLNDDYEGGLLNFPVQKKSLKPKPGTFLFFEGDADVPHEVKKIESGRRINLVTFYTLKKDHESQMGITLTDGPEQQITESYLNNSNLL
jgi:hypothetical protein